MLVFQSQLWQGVYTGSAFITTVFISFLLIESDTIHLHIQRHIFPKHYDHWSSESQDRRQNKCNSICYDDSEHDL